MKLLILLTFSSLIFASCVHQGSTPEVPQRGPASTNQCSFDITQLTFLTMRENRHVQLNGNVLIEKTNLNRSSDSQQAKDCFDNSFKRELEKLITICKEIRNPPIVNGIPKSYSKDWQSWCKNGVSAQFVFEKFKNSCNQYSNSFAFNDLHCESPSKSGDSTQGSNSSS